MTIYHHCQKLVKRIPAAPRQERGKFAGNDWLVIADRERMEGGISRIDVLELNGELVVRKFAAGWMPGDLPVEAGPAPAGWTIERIAAWLVERGWRVRTWPGGARAWRNGIRGVRTRPRARQLRRSAQHRPELAGRVHTYDFLIDL